MRKHAAILIVVTAFVLGGLVGALALRAQAPGNATAHSSHASWRQIAWPFPMDQWGKGIAFQCNAADCGVDVTVYLRAKIGFCNCSAGLGSDTDLDRVSDFDLLGGALYAQAPGQPVTIAWMKGRARPFAIRNGETDETLFSVGLHDNCDALVITAILPRGQLATVEPQLMALLHSKAIALWAEDTLGL